MNENTTAWKTPRQLAEDRVADMLGGFMPETDGAIDAVRAAGIVAAVFDILKEPDPDMLEAGRRELERTIILGYRGPNLAGAVWRTMFAEAEW